MTTPTDNYNGGDPLPKTLLTSDKIEKIVLYTALTGVVVAVVAIFGSAFVNIPASLQTAAVQISSVFYPAETRLQMLVEKRVISSNDTVSIEWNAVATEIPGKYLFAYKCVDGLSASLEINDTDYKPLACGKPIETTKGLNTLTLKLTSDKNRFIDVPFAVAFYPDGDASALFSSSALVTVENTKIAYSPSLRDPSSPTQEETDEEEMSNNVTQPTSTKPLQENNAPVASTQTRPVRGEQTQTQFAIPPSNGNSPSPRVLTGKSDLSVRIMNIGYIDPATKGFVVSGTVRPNQTAAVMFAVENIGTNTTNEWDFASVLPTNPPYIFQSPTQHALLPGERIEFTMGFDKVKEGVDSVEVKINIDPSSRVNESNESNNSVTATVQVVR